VLRWDRKDAKKQRRKKERTKSRSGARRRGGKFGVEVATALPCTRNPWTDDRGRGDLDGRSGKRETGQRRNETRDATMNLEQRTHEPIRDRVGTCRPSMSAQKQDQEGGKVSVGRDEEEGSKKRGGEKRSNEPYRPSSNCSATRRSHYQQSSERDVLLLGGLHLLGTG